MTGVRFRVRFSGRVQGVGFRFHAQKFAEAEGVCGWIQNMDDGTVEAVFEGEEEAVKRVMESCRTGNPSARISGTEVVKMKFTGEFTSFSIK
jgi:acylphosphatase